MPGNRQGQVKVPPAAFRDLGIGFASAGFNVTTAAQAALSCRTPDASLPGGFMPRIRTTSAALHLALVGNTDRGHLDPTSIRRRPSCSAKSAKSFVLNVASGRPSTRQQAAIQESLTGRGRPRR